MEKTTKLPEALSEKLKCCRCPNYLSTAPVGMVVNGKYKLCCRCFRRFPAKFVVRCHIFEELASLYSFPCKYRSRGCLEYIRFNESSTHEQKCLYQRYPCPVNYIDRCNWRGQLPELREHYQKAHSVHLLEESKFTLEIKTCEVYNLIELNGALLLLQLKCDCEKIWFNVVHMGMQEVAPKYRIKLSSKLNQRAMELEEKGALSVPDIRLQPSKSVEVDVDPLRAVLKSDVIECEWILANIQTAKTLEGDKIVCPVCSIHMVPPIYRCSLGHITCIDCKSYNDTCKTCKEANVTFTRAIDIENEAILKDIGCRWGCGKTFSSDKIRHHEQECHERIYKCPECEKTIGKMGLVQRHFVIEHPSLLLQVTGNDYVNYPIKSIKMYVLVQKELFHLNITMNIKNLWAVTVTYHGLPGLASCYQYEVRDHFDVLYYASKCNGHKYRISQTSLCDKVHINFYLNVRFKKHTKTDLWMPLD